ncbi:TdcA1-ORF1-ORF2 protein [Corchorus olitorius]|uniref:TdcA1-ORF1-ORF2 protein n=1 Tax=Corchorus olitorius TaxID=93759 RepID=A0A1R3KJX2_9ROSI|nr:TdcA1-ORF1-ORF2 protein [Corchorus olitorius]
MFLVVILLGGALFLQTKFNAALERAKEAARGDQEALRAIDEDAIFDEVAGGTKGRRLGLGNIARAERCGVVDLCSSLTQENQELRETIKSLSQDNEATKAKQMQSDQKLDKLQEYLQTMCAALAQQNINFPPLRILEQVSESTRTTHEQPQQPGPVENSLDKDNNIQDEDLEAHDEENNIG